MNWICFNGTFVQEEEPVFLASNRSFRYGDGLFETMRVCKGWVQLESLHFERLFHGLALMEFEMPVSLNRNYFREKIKDLCEKNRCGEQGRVRLSVFRGNGSLGEPGIPGYILEAWASNPWPLQLPSRGLTLDIFTGARKSQDPFSNLKSANFLPYVMADLFSKKKGLDDALVLNNSGAISDATIANVFLIKNGIISTPALSEGCVDGVMRKFIISLLRKSGILVQETTIPEENLAEADELFVTNAITGIRWVQKFRDTIYSNEQSSRIYEQLLNEINGTLH